MSFNGKHIKKVTVVTPLYNNRTDIIKAIKSVENQTYTNWEHIIVDDASTDGSAATVRNYIKRSRHKGKIKLLTNKTNKGAYHSRNRGLSKARGEFITILDSDDVFDDTKLEKQVARLVKHPRIISVSCWMQRVSPDGKRKSKIRKSNEICHMFRKSIIKDIGYYDSVRFGADSEYRARMIQKYGRSKISTIGEVLYLAKKRDGSLTTSPETRDRSVRNYYVRSYKKWHRTTNKLYIPYPLDENKRPFEVHEKMLPSYISPKNKKIQQNHEKKQRITVRKAKQEKEKRARLEAKAKAIAAAKINPIVTENIENTDNNQSLTFGTNDNEDPDNLISVSDDESDALTDEDPIIKPLRRSRRKLIPKIQDVSERTNERQTSYNLAPRSVPKKVMIPEEVHIAELIRRRELALRAREGRMKPRMISLNKRRVLKRKKATKSKNRANTKNNKKTKRAKKVTKRDNKLSNEDKKLKKAQIAKERARKRALSKGLKVID